MTLYNKVLSVFALLRDSIERRAARSEIASTFSADTSYSAGRLVVYDGVLYRCTNAHKGSWNADDFTASTVDDAITHSSAAADVGLFASEWKANTYYKMGCVVVYNKTFWRCACDHTSGSEWDENNWATTTVDTSFLRRDEVVSPDSDAVSGEAADANSVYSNFTQTEAGSSGTATLHQNGVAVITVLSEDQCKKMFVTASFLGNGVWRISDSITADAGTKY